MTKLNKMNEVEKFEVTLPDGLKQMMRSVEVKEDNRFLPYCYVSSAKSEESHYHLQIKGANLVEVKHPYFVLAITFRESTRELVGKRYENRTYQGGSKDEDYKEAVEEAEENKKIQVGQTHLLYIDASQDGFKGFVTLETYNSQASYWNQVLSKCHVASGNMVRIDQVDHTENLVVSKESGNTYLSGYKFKKWQVVPITKEIKEGFQESSKKSMVALKNFFEK